MKELQKKIQQREQSILDKKNELETYFSLVKNKMSSPPAIGIALLSGVMSGFMLPRKLFRRKKTTQVVVEASPTHAEPIIPDKKKPSHLHSLRFMLIDIVAIIAALVNIREAFVKLTDWLRKSSVG